MSLNVAQDDELLRLFQEAHFAWVFISIESPDVESLKETGKSQNLKNHMLDSVRRIYAHGIDVLGGFIVGFDNDTLATFERQYRFIVDSGIQAAMVGLLTALPRTPLYQRLEKEGRLITQAENANNTRLGTNIVPKRMPYDDMVASYKTLYKRLLEDRQIADRTRNKTRYLRDPVRQSQYDLIEGLAILGRLMARGILPGGFSRLFHFLRSLPLGSPRLLPQAITDWIMGLAMRDYVERRFDVATETRRAAASRLFASLRAALAVYLESGKVVVALKDGPASGLSLFVSFHQGMAGQTLLLAHREAPGKAAQAHPVNRHASYRVGARNASVSSEPSAAAPRPVRRPDLHTLRRELARDRPDRFVGVPLDSGLTALMPGVAALRHPEVAAAVESSRSDDENRQVDHQRDGGIDRPGT